MSNIAYPHLVIDDGEVLASPWEYRREQGEWLPLPGYLADWDYADSIRIRRTVRVNIAAVANRFGYPPDGLRLTLALTFGTSGGRQDRLRRRYASFELSDVDAEQEFDVTLDGTDISQRFTLHTQLLFSGPDSGGSRLAPRQKGLRLWADLARIQVEPEEPRFPIEAVSFAALFPEARHALWKLDWVPTDPLDEFTGCFRLFINDDFPDFVGKVSMGDIVTMQLLKGAVRLQIVRGFLEHDGLEAAIAANEPLSIATAIGGWLDLAFPGEDLESIRQGAAVNPSRFEAAVLSTEQEIEDA